MNSNPNWTVSQSLIGNKENQQHIEFYLFQLYLFTGLVDLPDLKSISLSFKIEFNTYQYYLKSDNKMKILLSLF